MPRSRPLSTLALTAVLGAVAACGPQGSAAVDEALQRDLDMAESAAMLIAPAAPRTQIVSALEGGEAPAPAPVPKAAPRPSPRPAVARAAPTPRRAPVQVAEAPAPTPEPSPEPPPTPVEVREPMATVPAAEPPREPAPATREIPAPRGRQGRGTWTTADVIRNAPFPILP